MKLIDIDFYIKSYKLQNSINFKVRSIEERMYINEK